MKMEDAGVASTLKIVFSNIQGQLTPQYRVESGYIRTHFEAPINIEGARVVIIQNIDFSSTKGQLTPQSEVGSGRNSNSSQIL